LLPKKFLGKVLTIVIFMILWDYEDRKHVERQVDICVIP